MVCGKSKLEDEHFDTLLNPTVLIEVLPESTSKYDRGLKAELYRRLESLPEHLLMAQDKPHVQRYRRQSDPDWLVTDSAIWVSGLL